MCGICKLCQKEADLKNSHILPEFLYLKTYDEKHRTMSIPSDKKEKLIQKGVRENLLCQECETKLSRYEGYAVKIINDVPNFVLHPSEACTFANVDYKLFKLFQLSILWRGGISTNQMFANVNLGRHEEKIRLMHVQDDPGRCVDYGCFIVMVPNPQKLDRIIMLPMPERLFGHNGVRFMTGNLFWYFIVSSHRVGSTVLPLLLQETGELRIWKAPWREQDVMFNIQRLFQSRRIT